MSLQFALRGVNNRDDPLALYSKDQKNTCESYCPG